MDTFKWGKTRQTDNTRIIEEINEIETFYIDDDYTLAIRESDV
jgi:hypothetical protein